METKPQIKPHVINYPEEYMVYWKVEAEAVDFNLPYYFAKKIQNTAEVLGAEVYVGVWWPYAYVTIVRDLEKEVEECVQENFEDSREECKKKCGDDQNCLEECDYEMRYNVWRACEESIVDDLRPKFADAAKEIESEAEIYGIAVKTHVMSDKEGLKLTIRLQGYSETPPIDLGKALFTQMLNVAKTQYYTNIEKFSREIAKFLMRYYGPEEFAKLVQNLHKSKMYISYIYDDLPQMRKYSITIIYNDDKISFLITEERKDDKWVITNVFPISVLSRVPDLTPA